MAYLSLRNSTTEAPDLPEAEGSWSSILIPPNWVMPMAFAAANGYGPVEAINAIGFSEPEGDLLLYRRFTDQDRERYPLLYGIREAWIVFSLSGGN